MILKCERIIHDRIADRLDRPNMISQTDPDNRATIREYSDAIDSIRVSVCPDWERSPRRDLESNVASRAERAFWLGSRSTRRPGIQLVCHAFGFTHRSPT
ncbi:hypothetical protein IQ235_08800, partial [Oscillatoriales cyanobacterium LEGE 11467]|nr:hypothetical protein [Zarconia navalis LEGE 11467]